jgi:hypothetical protein
VAVGPAGFFQADGEGDIGEEEARGNFFELGEEFFTAHEAVGGIGIGAMDAFGGQKDGFEDYAGGDAAPTVVAFFSDAVDDIEFVAEAPEPEEVLGIALAVGVDLENVRDVALAGEAVAGEAGLAMAAVEVGVDFKAGAELVAEALEDFEGAVGGAVVEAEEGEVFRPVFDFLEPFEHDLAEGGLLVVDGQDDCEFGGHFGEVGRIGRIKLGAGGVENWGKFSVRCVVVGKNLPGESGCSRGGTAFYGKMRKPVCALWSLCRCEIGRFNAKITRLLGF